MTQLETRDESMRNIIREKKASEAKYTKLQRKLKLLRERISSVCRNRSSFQGERIEQCLM